MDGGLTVPFSSNVTRFPQNDSQDAETGWNGHFNLSFQFKASIILYIGLWVPEKCVFLCRENFLLGECFCVTLEKKLEGAWGERERERECQRNALK